MKPKSFWTPIDQELQLQHLTNVELLLVPDEGQDGYLLSITPDSSDEKLCQVTTHPTQSPKQTRKLPFYQSRTLREAVQPLAPGGGTVVMVPRVGLYLRRPRGMELRVGVMATVVVTVAALTQWSLLRTGQSGALQGALMAGGVTAIIMLGLLLRVPRIADPPLIELPGGQNLDSDNIIDYARARMGGEFPETQLAAERRSAILERVQHIRDEYQTLGDDIVFRIDHPALFDPTAPPTARYETALLRWDDLDPEVDLDELEEAAAAVESAYAVALENATTLGIRHLPTHQRDTADRASRTARLAVGAATQGERDAALTQLNRLLDSLALFYLPPVKQVRAISAPEDGSGPGS